MHVGVDETGNGEEAAAVFGLTGFEPGIGLDADDSACGDVDVCGDDFRGEDIYKAEVFKFEVAGGSAQSGVDNGFDIGGGSHFIIVYELIDLRGRVVIRMIKPVILPASARINRGFTPA